MRRRFGASFFEALRAPPFCCSRIEGLRGAKGNNVCSAGFTARNALNQRWLYTAGHCSNGDGVTWGTAQTPIPYTAANPLGVNTFLDKEGDSFNIERTLRLARDGGFKWIRQGFPWSDIEIAGKGDFTDRRDTNKPAHPSWDKYDEIVAQANRPGDTVVVVTADRMLQSRVTAIGARSMSPSWLLDQL